MFKKILFTAGILGATGVILGAMAAHALEGLISPDSLESFKTGVRYQMYHSLALLILGLLYDKLPSRGMKVSFGLMLTGVLLFSGSIYLLATREVSGLGVSWLGPVTPLGGLLLIASWFTLSISALKIKRGK